MNTVAPYSNLLIEQMEAGLLDPMTIAKNLIRWMSEDDIKDFCEFYEIEDEIN